MAWLTLAVATACGGPQTAGSRPGIVANGGGAPGSGGSNGATGGSGSNGAAGGGAGAPTGTITDAGTLADALGAFDGGGCTDDTEAEPIGVAATGTFSGDGVSGAICDRGAFAYVQSTPADDGGAPMIELLIETTVKGSPAAALRFSTPGNVVSGEINVDIGLPAASAGTYAPAATCGSAVIVATLPPPDASICATDAGPDSFDCPTGCQSIGGISDHTCAPIAPELDFVALASDDCRGDSTTPTGSWTLTLTSVTPYPADAGAYGVLYYAVHGTLTATLADEQSDGGTSGVSLALTF
jgi:hypothetical protein